MTIAKTGSSASYAGNGVTLEFSFPFRFFDDTDLNVYVVVDATGVAILQTLTTHYTVSNTGTEAGGTVTMVTVPASGETLLIEREIPATQGTDYQANDPFPAETHEAALDRLTLLAQEQSQGATKHIAFPTGDAASPTLPTAPNRYNKLFAFDSAGAIQLRTAASVFAADDLPVFANLSAMISETSLSVGDFAIVEDAYNGEPETFDIVAAATYTANAQEVIDLTGSGLQAVSTRTWFKTFAERKADTRTFTAGDKTEVPGIGVYTAVASGGISELTNDGGQEFTLDNAGEINVLALGADRLGISDATATFAAAASILGTDGGVVYAPTGLYKVSDIDTVSNCITFTAGIKLRGDGYSSVLNPSGVAGTVNTIRFKPDAAFAADFAGVEDVFIGDPATGTRGGLHGVFLDTNVAGANLAQFKMSGAFIGEGGGQALYHQNNPANNANGGMYGATIESNSLRGGVKLDSSGDSIVIRENIISGATSIGLDIGLVSGASLLSILDNNITNGYGAVKVDNALRVAFKRNNIENLTAGATANNDGAIVNINMASGTLVASDIDGNLFSGFGATDATKHIRLRNARGTSIEGNTFLDGVGGISQMDIDATNQDIRVGPNTYNSAISITDTGAGTMGVQRDLTLQNSWVEYSTSETPKVFKTQDGLVKIEGTIKSGTATDGTVVATLPTGFRPASGTLLRLPITSGIGGAAQETRLEIDSAGSMTIYSAVNTMLMLGGVSFYADQNAVSFE